MSSNPPGRRWPRTHAVDEMRLQWEFLDFLRLTAVAKVDGLSPTLGAAAPLGTSPVVTAMGVVKHLTAVERYWLSIVGGGVDLPELWGVDAEASWRVGEGETPESVIAGYRAEWELAGRALAGVGPDEVTALHGDRTVRWVLVHVIQETARHVGHLDFLREMADGVKGE